MIQHVAQVRRIAQLSDIHLPAAGFDASLEGYPADQLAHTLEHLLHGAPCDAVIVTGDLTNEAGPIEYLQVKEQIERVANAWNAPIVWVIGNHDNRIVFTKALPPGSQMLVGAEQSAATVTWVGGLRIIGLDVVRSGEEGARISDTQLYALEAELSNPASEGTLLAMHHPIPSPASAEESAGSFEGADRLTDIVRQHNVVGIVSGHLHRPGASVVGGVLQWTGAGLSTVPELHEHIGRVQMYRAPGYSILEVADGVMSASHAAVFESEPVAEFDLAQTRQGRNLSHWPHSFECQH